MTNEISVLPDAPMAAEPRVTKASGYVYDVTYIDFWYGWHDPWAPQTPNHEPVDPDQVRWIAASVIRAIRDIARVTGWEGDIRGGPYVAPVPGPDYEPERGWFVALKQDNNGTTYLWSPVALPWLAGRTA